MANLIVHAVPGHQTGMTTGFNTVARTVGSALAATLLTTGATATGPTAGGFGNAFLVAAIAPTLSTVAAVAVPRRTATTDHTPGSP